MDETKLAALLHEVKGGALSVEAAVAKLKHWPAEMLDFARLDHHRTLRTGLPEVVFGENKSAEQIGAILARMLGHSERAMATRVSADKAAVVIRSHPDFVYHPEARILTAGSLADIQQKGAGGIVVLCAGTSDIPVAEEAWVTATYLGNRVEKLHDVGVAGIHRLLSQKALLDAATVLIVVAGMEGALPSVVGGLVDKPIIAVPTSIGYGTGLGGVAALLGMLNSCAPGVSVVNIDNGFGAGCMAAAINRQVCRRQKSK